MARRRPVPGAARVLAGRAQLPLGGAAAQSRAHRLAARPAPRRRPGRRPRPDRTGAAQVPRPGASNRGRRPAPGQFPARAAPARRGRRGPARGHPRDPPAGDPAQPPVRHPRRAGPDGRGAGRGRGGAAHRAGLACRSAEPRQHPPGARRRRRRAGRRRGRRGGRPRARAGHDPAGPRPGPAARRAAGGGLAGLWRAPGARLWRRARFRLPPAAVDAGPAARGPAPAAGRRAGPRRRDHVRQRDPRPHAAHRPAGPGGDPAPRQPVRPVLPLGGRRPSFHQQDRNGAASRRAGDRPVGLRRLRPDGRRPGRPAADDRRLPAASRLPDARSAARGPLAADPAAGPQHRPLLEEHGRPEGPQPLLRALRPVAAAVRAGGRDRGQPAVRRHRRGDADDGRLGPAAVGAAGPGRAERPRRPRRPRRGARWGGRAAQRLHRPRRRRGRPPRDRDRGRGLAGVRHAHPAVVPRFAARRPAAARRLARGGRPRRRRGRWRR